MNFSLVTVLSFLFSTCWASYEGPLRVEVYHPPSESERQHLILIKDRTEIERLVPLTFHEALKMVRRQKLQHCVALIICTLTCDPHGFGADGEETFIRLNNFNEFASKAKLSDKQMKDVALFKEAQSKGVSHVGNCELCSHDYHRCSRSIESLLKLFLNLDIAL